MSRKTKGFIGFYIDESLKKEFVNHLDKKGMNITKFFLSSINIKFLTLKKN